MLKNYLKNYNLLWIQNRKLIKPYGISTRILKDDRPFHPKRLWDTCHKYLDKRIYRSKGFFWLASRNDLSLIWNQVGGGINLELIGIWKSSIVEDQNNRLLDFELELLKEQLKKEKKRTIWRSTLRYNYYWRKEPTR